MGARLDLQRHRRSCCARLLVGLDLVEVRQTSVECLVEANLPRQTPISPQRSSERRSPTQSPAHEGPRASGPLMKDRGPPGPLMRDRGPAVAAPPRSGARLMSGPEARGAPRSPVGKPHLTTYVIRSTWRSPTADRPQRTRLPVLQIADLAAIGTPPPSQAKPTSTCYYVRITFHLPFGARHARS